MTEPTPTTTSTTSPDSTATDQPATETEEPTLKSVYEQLEALTDRVAELEAEVKRKDERIEQLEAQRENEHVEVKSDGDTASLTDLWIAGIPLGPILQNTIEDVDQAHNQLDEVENLASKNGASGMETDTTESEDVTTPLERICTLPEHVADRELTTNQKRARFIARDVQDYAEKAPDGLVIDSQTIAKVIPLPRERSLTRKLWPALWTSSRSSGKTTLSKRNDAGRNSSWLRRKQPTDITIVVIGQTDKPPQEA